MTSELPGPWAEVLAPRGIHSYRDMGAAADIAHETARRLVTGGKTSAATVNKVADALFDGDRTKVWALYGEPLDDFGPWELPPEASLLNEVQREAVLGVIRAMVPANAQKGGDGDAGDTGRSPSTKGPGAGPADQPADTPTGIVKHPSAVDADEEEDESLLVDEAAYDPKSGRSRE